MSPEALPGGPAQRRGGRNRKRTDHQSTPNNDQKTPTRRRAGVEKTQVPWGMVSAQDVATYAKAPSGPSTRREPTPRESVPLGGSPPGEVGSGPYPSGCAPHRRRGGPKGTGSCVSRLSKDYRGSDHRVAQTNPPVRGRVSADRSEEAAQPLTTPRLVRKSSTDDSVRPHCMWGLRAFGRATPALPDAAEFPLHGLRKGRLEARPLNLPPNASRTRYRCTVQMGFCLRGVQA